MERSELIEEITSRLDAIEREVAELKQVVSELDKTEVKVLHGSTVKKTDARLISDLRKAIGLNDRIRFQRELFIGDAALMDSTIEALNGAASYAEALEYLSQNFSWDDENDTVKYFKDILSRKAY